MAGGLAEIPLHERDGDLRAGLEAVSAAAGGRGSVLVVEGPAGIGKTTVLAALADAARESGLRVLRARGGELESDLAWGLVRGLLTPAVAKGDVLDGAAELARPALGLGADSDAGGDMAGALHGLYWTCANLAEAGPLALLVDDAHWGDVPSLRFLAYLGARLEDLPVLLVLGVRTGDPGADAVALQALRTQPAAQVRSLAPLSEQASGAIVRGALGAEADPEFAQACHAASGGNPFFLHELVRQLERDAVPATGSAAPGVLGVTPASVARSVLLRLARLPDPARELARAVSVLGVRAALDEAASLAGLDAEEGLTAADALVRAEIAIADPELTFVHPLVRAAIYDDLGPLRCSEWHWRAAELLRDRGAPADRIAVQLLAGRPRGEDWAVGALRSAAASAMDRGAPDAAADLLARALEEPPPAEQRALVIQELGHSELRSWNPACVEHFREAAELATEPALRADATLAATQVLIYAERAEEGVALAERYLAEAGVQGDRELTIEAVLLDAVSTGTSHAAVAAERAGRWREPPAGETVGELSVLAALATREIGSGSVSRARELAERALADGRLLQGLLSFVPSYWKAVFALIFADALDDAAACSAEANDLAIRVGSPVGQTIASLNRSYVALLRGDLRDAEAEAAQALSVAHEIWPPAIPALVAVQVEALTEQGRLEDAAAVVARWGMDGDLPLANAQMIRLQAVRGRLRRAQGDAEGGRADLLAAGERADAAQLTNPALIAWRADVGRADEELELARAAESPRAEGVALRALGRVEESVAMLRGTPACLELARSLVELGSARRRSGARNEAKDALREGLDLASRCGAEPLAERAREELRLAGARPRRDEMRGRDALTAAELRVASLAAAGKSNKGIAEELFVSLRTVETHLTHAYQKLDISKRPELAEALKREAG